MSPFYDQCGKVLKKEVNFYVGDKLCKLRKQGISRLYMALVLFLEKNAIRIGLKSQLMLLELFIWGVHGFLSCSLCGRYPLSRWPFRAGLTVGIPWEKQLPFGQA